MLTRRGLLITASAMALTGPAYPAPIPVMLYKNPECACCDGYAAYLRHHGFAVTAKATHDLAEISRKAATLPGMPDGSAGMSGKKAGPFKILAIGTDGKTNVYMTL